MCDVRLFKSAYMDYQVARTIYQTQHNDEMFFNSAAYHLQQSVEKIIKGVLECVGVTVPNTHRIPSESKRCLRMFQAE
ncbi:HEPN domain-containing protein [Parablautia muri]|uniref:HEPN domain-containing protein n=1 Tax=Parablautia muri TaxID=2320879 RepID=A0A9X5BDP4_9FIRM|nr:HEPN domain-containing protein [Parablautia muri]NBJ91772.1 HEPN domain-containing protein [Parablautia muri]